MVEVIVTPSPPSGGHAGPLAWPCVLGSPTYTHGRYLLPRQPHCGSKLQNKDHQSVLIARGGERTRKLKVTSANSEFEAGPEGNDPLGRQRRHDTAVPQSPSTEVTLVHGFLFLTAKNMFVSRRAPPCPPSPGPWYRCALPALRSFGLGTQMAPGSSPSFQSAGEISPVSHQPRQWRMGCAFNSMSLGNWAHSRTIFPCLPELSREMY